MDNALALSVGGEVKAVGLSVGGKLFVFTPNQQQFLLNLQKLKNVTAAALSIGKEEAWGDAFLRSRKFQTYLSMRMKAFSDQNGMDVNWWYSFGKKLTDGYEEYFTVECAHCAYRGKMDLYEVESFRKDDMTLEVPCPGCFHTLESELKHDVFKPSREQVEGWKAIGDRLLPKVERAVNTFENVDIVFSNKEES